MPIMKIKIMLLTPKTRLFFKSFWSIFAGFAGSGVIDGGKEVDVAVSSMEEK